MKYLSTAMITLLLSTQADAQCARQYCDSNGNCYYQQQRCTQYDHDTARAYNEQRGYGPYDSRGTCTNVRDVHVNYETNRVTKLGKASFTIPKK